MKTKEKSHDEQTSLVEALKLAQLHADQVWLIRVHESDDEKELQSAKRAGRNRAMEAWDKAIAAVAAGDKETAMNELHAAAMGAAVYGSAFYEWRAYDRLDAFIKEGKL